MKKKEIFQLLILLIFGVFLLLPGLGETALIDWDENIYAEAARQMVVRGDYLSIFINDYPFAEKPPFFFWLQSLSYHFWGINEFGARFPSVVSGLLLVILLYRMGCYTHSHQFGLLWGGTYLTSLLPGIFARSAVIDHTFNLFIATAAFLLYAYDQNYMAQHELGGPSPNSQAGNKEDQQSSSTLFRLSTASIFMGLAVLTKGPLGGVIPLVAFGSYKIFSEKRTVPVGHFLYCGILSLLVATSWYWLNLYVHGSEFIEGFIRFQLSLFSKPLEGHTGPFFYHWGVAIFGLLPWTPLLLLGPHKLRQDNKNPHTLRMLRLSSGWILFVLILFSFVSTKLPHYSASVYIPLSWMAAILLEPFWNGKKPFPRWLSGIIATSGVLLAGGFLALPFAAQDYVSQKTPGIILPVSTEIFWIGSGLLLCFLAGGILFWKNYLRSGVMIIAFGMLFWTQGVWRFQVPMGLRYVQEPMLQLVNEAHKLEQKVVFYRFVSFAALFYGQRPIEMLHTYKFPGDPAILNHPQEKEIAVITEKQHEKNLLEEHPLVRRVKSSGNFVLYHLPKNTSLENTD